MATITSQKIYAILRKAGHSAAKWESSGMVRGWGEYSSGPRVCKTTGDALVVTYESGHVPNALGHERLAMAKRIVPTLEAAGVKGVWVDAWHWQIAEE